MINQFLMKNFLPNDYQLPIYGCLFILIAMLCYWLSLAIPKNNLIFKVSKLLTIIANLFFAAALLFRWISEGYFPLSNLYESLIFLCWGLSALHLFLEQKTQSRILGATATPIIFFIAGFASLQLPIEMQKAISLVPSLQSNWLMMHVSMMMISYATLIIGSLISMLYLVFSVYTEVPKKLVNFASYKNHYKNQKEYHRIYNGISVDRAKESLLQTLDSWSYRIIGLGFPFLTIGIISGAIWANEAWGSYWSWDPKETWALITWLIFAIYLHARLLKGWQGKKAAMVSSLGFFILWICYLGVNFLGKGLHTYGWVAS